jgi:acyl carrier protein
MTNEEKLAELAELFEVDSVTPETRLDTLNWDSMSMLSVIALAKARFDRRVTGSEVRAMETIQDILNVMQRA